MKHNLDVSKSWTFSSFYSTILMQSKSSSSLPVGAVRFISLNESVIRGKIILRTWEMFKILAAVECVNSGRYLAKSQDILIFQKHPQMSQFPFDSAATTLIDMSSNYIWGAPWGPRLVSPTFIWLQYSPSSSFSYKNEKIIKSWAWHRLLASCSGLCSAALCWHLV